jgi:hypothetical protein
MTTPIVGLASPAPQCGKSTVAAMLLNLSDDGVELPFAGTLKAMVRTFLSAAALRDDQIHLYENQCKELVIPEIGVSYRHLCQTLGTEWGRACVAPDIWIRVWGMSVDNLINDGCQLIVVPDVRYRNELEAVRDAGGQIWWVERAEAVAAAPARTMAHASEGELCAADCDRMLDNNGTLHQLSQKVAGEFEAYRHACSE